MPAQLSVLVVQVMRCNSPMVHHYQGVVFICIKSLLIRLYSKTLAFLVENMNIYDAMILWLELYKKILTVAKAEEHLETQNTLLWAET